MKNHLLLFTTIILILGGLIGAGVGILYAPRPGVATRAVLHNRTVQLQAGVTRDQRNVAKDLNKSFEQVKDRVNNFFKEARIELNKIGGQFKGSFSSISIPSIRNLH